MKISKAFHDALWDYSASNVTVVAGHGREREIWMGSREDEYIRCEAAFAKLEKLWTFDLNDLEALKTLHRKFLDHYMQGRSEEGRRLFKELDGLIESLREKWKVAQFKLDYTQEFARTETQEKRRASGVAAEVGPDTKNKQLTLVDWAEFDQSYQPINSGYPAEATRGCLVIKVFQKKWASVYANEDFLFVGTCSGFRTAASDPAGAAFFLRSTPEPGELGVAVAEALSKSRMLLPKEWDSFFEAATIESNYESWVADAMGRYGYSERRKLFQRMKLCNVELSNGILSIRPTFHEKLEAWSGKGVGSEACVDLVETELPRVIGEGVLLALSRCLER